MGYSYFIRVLLALDQLANVVLCNGAPDETMSAASYRMHRDGRFWGFNAEHTGGWTLPGPWEPHRLLARSENPAALPREGILGPWRG